MGTSDGRGGLDRDALDILIAVDGEPHTEPAVQWALRLAVALERRVVAVHVKDPYLKQFYNDIYAQGRQEYLDHVEACLEEMAADTLAAFARAADACDVSWTGKVRCGSPAEELIAEVREGDYGLLVMGVPARRRSRRRRKQSLAMRVVAEAGDLPAMIVPG